MEPRSVSLPPTMLRPRPILSLFISMVVSRPGLISQVAGSEGGSSVAEPVDEARGFMDIFSLVGGWW